MSANTTGLDLPNAFTPLAFFPEDIANQISLQIHFAVACLGIVIWDVLNYVAEDYEVIFRKKFSWKTLVFVIARLSPVAFLLTISITFTSKLSNCKWPHFCAVAFLVINNLSTSLLFYFRLCAIYKNNGYIVGFFGLGLLSLLGTRILTFFGMAVEHIGTTKYCAGFVGSKNIIAGTIVDIILDALTFGAIMYKLNRMRVQDGGESWMSALFRRPNSERLPDIFVKDSQVYYCVAFGMSTVSIISFFALGNPPESPVRAIMMFPQSVVVNCIAIRIYRNMRSGRPGLHISAAMGESTHAPKSPIKFQSPRNRFRGIGPGETTWRVEESDEKDIPISAIRTSTASSVIGKSPA